MKKILIIALIIVSGLLIIIVNGYKEIDNNLLSVYMDNERVESIPDKGKGTYLKSVCDDENIKTKWDNDNWGLFVSGLSKKVKCNIYFSSDVEKHSWQVDSVSRNVLTTDIYTVRLVGSDNSKISPNLNIDDIKFLVSNCDYAPIKKDLEIIESSDNKIIYELKIHMLKGEGKLVLRINSGTLKDDSGNESNSTDLDTGITIAKNNNTKILVWQDWENNVKNNLGLYYKNLTIDTDMSISTTSIINDKYDIVIYYYPFWHSTVKLNDLFKAGINVINQYNDYTEGLIINRGDGVGDTVSGKVDIYKVVDNGLNKYIGDNFADLDGARSLWYFNANAKVLYKVKNADLEYDAVGYLKENDNIWFNIAMSPFVNYAPIIEFVMGRLEE